MEIHIKDREVNRMSVESNWLTMSDGVSVFLKSWLPNEPIKAVVQLCHGMTEHIERYHDFATYLAEHGYLVIGHDHRGHGQTGKEQLGFISEKDGGDKLVEDAITITEYIQAHYPNLPVYLIGHSMGSFVVRNYLTKRSELVAGAILIGTGWKPNFLLFSGLNIARFIILISGKKKTGSLLNKLSFFGYNKRTEKETDFDWLSKDRENVENYLHDPYCGYTPSNQFFVDLFQLMKSSQNKEKAKHIPTSFPLLLLAGNEDPVGDYGKGVQQAAKFYQSIGLTKVKTKLYSPLRHEILHDCERESVYNEIIHWLELQNA